MENKNSFWILAAMALVIPTSIVRAQVPADYAVQVNAAVVKEPARITLAWPADSRATGYSVYRKVKEATTWGSLVNLPGTASGYADTSVTAGNTYEYRVDRTAVVNGTSLLGQGYVFAGIESPLVDARGSILLLVDDTFSLSLSNELARLQQDLAGDGWTVRRRDVPRTSTVAAVKSLVVADYSADPANTRALFLFGHIPVPYSGDFAPDGHPEHVGAWPTDVYYADMNGQWTDSSVNDSAAADPRNRNIPNDGKFDQSTLPSDVELQVGRVDLSNLPVFAKSETELLRQYLNKDHNFRHKLFEASPRAMVSDWFGAIYGECFAASGWRNFPALVGAANVSSTGTWMADSAAQSYLWGYGCGPGSFSSASGITTSTQLSTNDPQVVFTMLFGSYLGDWDSRNNLMRSELATPTYTLTCAWAGRPAWMFHHMGMGETIGYGARLSQNNSSTYAGGARTRGVHVALMGDPTLRMHVVAPPKDLLVFTNGTGGVQLQWTASAEPVLGYHVYRANAQGLPFTRLTAIPVTTTTYSISSDSGSVYMVRAVKLQTSASGSYYNASQGVIETASGTLQRFAGTRLSLTPKGNGTFLLSGTGLPGQVQQIQAKDSGSADSWFVLGLVTNDTSGQFRFTNTCTFGQRTYRTKPQ